MIRKLRSITDLGLVFRSSVEGRFLGLPEAIRGSRAFWHRREYPLYAQLWTGYECGLNCAGCKNRSRQGQAHEPTYSELRRVILALRQLRVYALTLTGGEPLLKPWLPSLVALAHDRRMPNQSIPLVCINSNGLPLLSKPEPLRSRLIQALASSGVSFVNLSLDRLHWPQGDERKRRTRAILSLASQISEHRIAPAINWLLTSKDDTQEIHDLIEQTVRSGCHFSLLLYSSVGGEFSVKHDGLLPTVRQVRSLAKHLVHLKKTTYVPRFGTVGNTYSELRWMMEDFDPQRPWRCRNTKQSVLTIKPSLVESQGVFELGFCQEFSLISTDGQLDLESYRWLFDSPTGLQLRHECNGCFYTCYIRCDPRFGKGLGLEELRNWLVTGAYLQNDHLGALMQTLLFRIPQEWVR